MPFKKEFTHHFWATWVAGMAAQESDCLGAEVTRLYHEQCGTQLLFSSLRSRCAGAMTGYDYFYLARFRCCASPGRVLEGTAARARR
jgi:hypothetical protein